MGVRGGVPIAYGLEGKGTQGREAQGKAPGHTTALNLKPFVERERTECTNSLFCHFTLKLI